ncbi:MAG: hypothetical protein OEZ68_09945 [Gammaproteobacteria bacterium]|nr:hypothetical protein [Gammaproteobacteria bacterium]MDH5801110.1 hypothetical protein [Gammaproteobacteria bacterium]
MGRILLSLLTFSILILPPSARALEFSLFGDVSFTSHDGEQSFGIGSFNLIADQHVSETSSITTDLIFQTGEHGIEVELERFKITKETELANVTMGRFHKTLGFWNHNFNHGSLSQDTASRPFFLELDNSHEGIFPAHMVGLLLGKERENYSWQFAYGNNAGMNTEEAALAAGSGGEMHGEMESLNRSDPSGDKAYAFRGTYRVNNDMEVGMFLMANNIVETGGEDGATALTTHGNILFTQNVVGFDASYNKEKFYVFGEYYNVSYEDNPFIAGFNTASYTADAFYVQGGYRYSSDIRIALRYENLSFGDNATFLQFHELVPQTRTIVAVNYRIEESNSLRFEMQNISPQGGGGESSITIQWFFYLL